MKISDKVPPSLKQPLLFYQPLLFGGKNLNPPPFWENFENSTSPFIKGDYTNYVVVTSKPRGQ